ncbi:fungal-specific transcription factor domain-containing protein [Cercophora scortea]|uniref:Fungal-specific transcription factor domain-containing protein n=1 Tax=Cercophora scortea TaxID=314031 RepID=A0AAE0M6J6_9PEZI|nr:fungal-specific transcription factor domain-containing protein [Cercophora scortea]
MARAKESKKKCNEERPQCARCVEHKFECIYDNIKPRKRRKRESIPSISRPGDHAGVYPQARRLSEISHDSHDLNSPNSRSEAGDRVGSSDLDGSVVFSPTDSTFGSVSSPNFSLYELSNLLPTNAHLPTHSTDPRDAVDDEAQSGYHHTPGRTTTVVTPGGSTSLNPDLAMIAPCPVGSPLLEFSPPAFSEFSDRPNRRAIVDHFCNVLSHLIVFREECGNPFQQLVLPLTRKCSPVMNAIFALGSAHLEYRGVQNLEQSLYFHNRAIQGLGKLIQRNATAHRNEILAAIMLLVYYEVGALTVMCTNQGPSNPTSEFLERAFRFYDVIAALSNGTAPLSAAPAPGCLIPFSPMGAPAASPLCNVDTLLGMATTLWPIIHRLSSLPALKNELGHAVRTNAPSSKIAVLRTELRSTAEAIEAALAQWRPHLPPDFIPEDENEIQDPAPQQQQSQPTKITTSERSRLHSILHNALAYRHSAFVYLHRTIYGHPRSHPTVQQHARRALAHCGATVRHAGPMGALLWPLFVAACEAVDVDDRALARRVFEDVRRRQGMMNIERAREVVGEVWRRGDVMEKGDAMGEGKGRVVLLLLVLGGICGERLGGIWG